LDYHDCVRGAEEWTEEVSTRRAIIAATTRIQTIRAILIRRL